MLEGGTPIEVERTNSPSALWDTCAEGNAKLVQSITEQDHTFGKDGKTVAEEIHRLTQKDVDKHRVTKPVLWEEFDSSSCLLQPRFGVEQMKDDGSSKIRPIDNMSWCAEKYSHEQSGNGHTWPAENFPQVQLMS